MLGLQYKPCIGILRMLFTMLIVRTPNIYTASGRVMALLVIPWQQEEFKMAATVNPNLREIV